MIRYDTEDAIKRVLKRHLGEADRDLLNALGTVCEWSEKTALHEAMPQTHPEPDFPLVMLSKMGLLTRC